MQVLLWPPWLPHATGIVTDKAFSINGAHVHSIALEHSYYCRPVGIYGRSQSTRRIDYDAEALQWDKGGARQWPRIQNDDAALALQEMEAYYKGDEEEEDPEGSEENTEYSDL